MSTILPMQIGVPRLTRLCEFQKVTPLQPPSRISKTKGRLSKRTEFVREIVKEVAGLAPYERRVIELLRNSKDKRARKLAKKRVSRPSSSLHLGIRMKRNYDKVHANFCGLSARYLRPREEKSRRDDKGDRRGQKGRSLSKWCLAIKIVERTEPE